MPYTHGDLSSASGNSDGNEVCHSFRDIGLSETVLRTINDLGYTTPTPIQQEAIPPALAGRDILGIAQTGTGKTAAFTLPLLCLLERGRARARMPRILILEPTRELAAQAEENFIKYGAHHKLSVALLIGGVGFTEQEEKIERGVDVLIATPGRLLDFMDRGKLLLTALEVLVVDEADRMLDMGFIPDIEKICKLVPTTRQTLLFSATMPPEITRLAETFLADPVRLEMGRVSSPATTIEQLFVSCEAGPKKRAVLRALITTEKDLKNAIIFCNRKRDVNILYKSLRRHGFSAAALHGDLDQRARSAALDSFKNGDVTFLICSDVAARGLDIPEVTHVFNFDVPLQGEDYIHRIGRTGRAGCLGKAITLVTRYDKRYIEIIQKLLDQPLSWRDTSSLDLSLVSDVVSDSSPPSSSSIGNASSQEESERNTSTGSRSSYSSHRQMSGRGRPLRSETDASRSPDNREQRQPPERLHESRRPVRYEIDDPPVVGLGAHVPMFLLREVSFSHRNEAPEPETDVPAQPSS